MSTGELVFDAGQGSIFIQPEGPGTELKWLGCHDLDDIEAPMGDIEVEMCRDGGGNYYVVGQRKAAPESVTTTITGLSGKTRDWLEKLQCSGYAAIYVLQHSCGRAENPMNYERGKVLQRININSRTWSNFAHHLETGQATHALSIQAWPPLLDIADVVIGRIVQPSTLALNDIWTDPGQCAGDCGNQVDPGDIGGIAPDSAPAAATADVLFTTNGLTWAAGAADPFAAALHIMSIAAFQINKTGRRWIVSKEGTGAVQGQIAYSDNAGTTWTVVSVGGAAVAHCATYGKCIWAPKKEFVLMACHGGYIYKSYDGGETWTAKESAVITAGDYKGIHFADEKYGAAVAAAGVVATTKDGGETWTAGTVIGGGAGGNLTVVVFNDRRIMVGDDLGKLWQSTDFGVTWTQITGWTGSGAGDVRSLSFLNEYVGFMAYNSAAPVGAILRTIDGGANWVLLPNTPTNVGLNSILALTENSCYAVGEASGGTGVLLKVSEL